MLSLIVLIYPCIIFTTARANVLQTPAPSTCILLGDPCPSSSTCSPTTTCGGLCVPKPTTTSEIPCTVGNNGPCPTGSTCTPTMTCPVTAPCGGACIGTAQPPPPTTSPEPTYTPCVVGDTVCPTDKFCYQTETCRGLCKSTAPPTPTSTPCGGNHPPYCSKKYKCVQKNGKPCGYGNCHGHCVPKYEY